MGKKGELAEQLFKQGYNCSQSVACAFSDEMGLPIDTVARLVGGFGGGMGRMREVCGAVSGMTFVLSALRGYSDPKAPDAKQALYAEVQKAAGAFKEQNGSIICRELLGLAAPESTPVPAPRTSEYYQKRPCPALCRMAADILEAQLAQT